MFAALYLAQKVAYSLRLKHIAFVDVGIIALGFLLRVLNFAVRLLDVGSGTLLRLLEGHTHAVDNLAFSPDGQYLASASYDGIIRLWGIRP